MNERIKQLAEKAGMTDDKFSMFFAKDNHNENGVDLEEFTKLIVRECSGFVYNYPEKYLTRNQAREVCLSMEEHFGVEE